MSFTPENQALWDLCMKHGARIATHETVSQVAILEMYDAILPLCPATPEPDTRGPDATELAERIAEPGSEFWTGETSDTDGQRIIYPDAGAIARAIEAFARAEIEARMGRKE